MILDAGTFAETLQEILVANGSRCAGTSEETEFLIAVSETVVVPEESGESALTRMTERGLQVI